MKNIVGITYTLIMTVVVAIIFATTLYHISYSLYVNSYFIDSLSFAASEIFKIGGLSRYITAFFSSNVTLLIFYLAAVWAAITYSFASFSAKSNETIPLSLIALYLLYSGYSDTRFIVQVTSSLFVSLAYLSACYIFKKSRVVGIVYLPLLLAFMFVIAEIDKTVTIFISLLVANVVLSNLIIPKLKERTIITYLLFLLVLAYSVVKSFKSYNPSLAHIMKMEQTAIDDDWSGVLNLTKETKFSNQLSCFYTNLSLIKSGQLSVYLFQFPQASGIEGINVKNDFQRLNDKLYDAIGLPTLALRCAFENYIVYGKNSYNLKRLIYLYNKCGKESIARKFSAMLPNYTSPKPTGYITEGLDSMISKNSDLINILECVVDSDSKNRTAYEVLMACYALNGRVVKFAERCVLAKNYFKDGLPIYFQQLLLMYEDYMTISKIPYIEYEIDSDIRKHYEKFKKSRSHREFFGSYWYYMYHINPAGNKFYIN